ncbi:type III secretion system export apparatus subunit SctT [Escherichia coli]|nr:type III secretion system export apparatus subunit SctT [Escherichia coli]
MGEAILYQLHSLLAATALGFCRLAPTFYLLPFFASGNIPTVVRHPIIIVVSCALVQHYHYELLNLNEIDIALFAAREIIIGLFIACLLASPFWIFLAIGSFIDNQRGATLSSTLDPATGVDTSELARLFNLFSAAVYLTKGGMNFILETLWQSYNLWPSGNSLLSDWGEMLFLLILYCLGSMIIVLIFDFIAEYFLFMKDMKMDKQEVKREYKEQEGNPEIKSKRRERIRKFFLSN